MSTKQVIVMRTDLNMPKGKMVAQGAHASMAFLTRRLVDARDDFVDDTTHVVAITPVEEEWLANSFIKICVKVPSEIDLLFIYDDARKRGVESHLVTDDGRTMFNGVRTNTCVAIGPDRSEIIDRITGHLPLL